MDHESFDRLAKLLGAAGTRRTGLGALLGAGVAAAHGLAEAKKGKSRSQKKGKAGGRQKRKGLASVEAVDCLSLGHGSNVSGCNYSGEDHSGEDLSSSRMNGAIFTDGILIETDLSSSGMRNAVFLRARLCGADLRSSSVGGANFRGADLTLANLKSSGGCGSILVNAATTFCGTVMCNGTVNNADCPGGLDPDVCCAPCGDGQLCVNNECVAVCDEESTPTSCDCLSDLVSGDPVCVNTTGPCEPTCSLEDPSCPAGTVCAFSPCCGLEEGVGVCNPVCGDPDDCTCGPGVPDCDNLIKCGEVGGAALRIAAISPQKRSGR